MFPACTRTGLPTGKSLGIQHHIPEGHIPWLLGQSHIAYVRTATEAVPFGELPRFTCVFVVPNALQVEEEPGTHE